MTGLLERALGWIADHAWAGYANGTNISDRTSSNTYTAPSNGMVKISCTYRSASYVMAYADGELIAELSSPSNANAAANQVTCVPVFKGQKLHCTRSSTYSYLYFIPYKNMGGGVLPDLNRRKAVAA